jgi:hypothetical protein
MKTFYAVFAPSPSENCLSPFILSTALGISTDKLLGQDADIAAEPEPGTLRLWRRLKKLEQLPPHDQKSVLKMIDALADQAEKRKAS